MVVSRDEGKPTKNTVAEHSSRMRLRLHTSGVEDVRGCVEHANVEER